MKRGNRQDSENVPHLGLYFAEPQWKEMRRFSEDYVVMGVKYLEELGLMRLTRFHRYSGNYHEIFRVKTFKTVSIKIFENYLKNNIDKPKICWESRMLLLLISFRMADIELKCKQVNPFTFKQIRSYDFGYQVLQAEYLPNTTSTFCMLE